MTELELPERKVTTELAGTVPAKSDEISRYVRDVIAPANVSASVLCAFGEVDRAEFVPRDSRNLAYTNFIIRVKGHAGENTEVISTISEPMIVARMVDLLELSGHERVLELGSSTGYQAGILSRLAAHVDTIEIDPTLAEVAEHNLERLGYSNVTVHAGDGAKGIKERAPFDAIIVTAALKSIPKPLMDQLAVGGRIVAPIGPVPNHCELTVLRKVSEEEIVTEGHGDCRFVPVISDEEGTWTNQELQELKEKEEHEEEEYKKYIETKLQGLKEWLVQRWEENELSYEDGIGVIKYQFMEILKKTKGQFSEEAILEMVNFIFAITRPAQKKESEETETEPEELAEAG